jgi:ubiquinone/menaquinone biosynthesis C-methylase UbiE
MKPFALAFCSLFLLAFGFVSAQPEPPKKAENERYETRRKHDPHGIGKFYMGREIAQVMSYQGASWLERPEREKEEKVSKLMPSLDIKPGDVVVDLGAGSGFHTMKLSKLVGPKGKVYAVDIQPEMLDIIGKRVRKENIENVVLVHNTEKDPKLPAGKIDMILMVDVYHELSYPYEVTLELVKALKPGGRLVFVEFRLEDKKVPILDVHRMSIKQVMKEMEPHALKHAKTLNHLPWQHVIIFEKVEAKTEPMQPKEDSPKKEKRCRDENRD